MYRTMQIPGDIMTRILQALAAGVLFTLAVCFGLTARLIFRLDQRLDGRSGVLMRLEGVESKANGTLDNLDKAAANVNAASSAWAASSQGQAASVSRLAQHLDKTLSAADGALGAARGTVATFGEQARSLAPLLASAQRATDAIPPLLNETQTTIAEARKPMEAGAAAFADFDAMLRSPDLAAAFRNTSALTASAADAGADVQHKIHSVLYPPPCSGRLCWLDKTLQVVRAIGPLAEPAYYVRSIFKPAN